MALLWGRSESRREKALSDLQTTLEEKRLLLQQQIHIQENERRFLAHTLHDEMGQTLVALQTYVAFSLKALSKNLPESVRDGIHEISTLTQRMQTSIRCQLNDLRPATLDRLGLKSALKIMAKDFGKREQIDYHISISDKIPVLSDEENIHLYRIVQEALKNIEKYAEATHVSIDLDSDHSTLTLKISDNGRGFSEQAQSGLGLMGMRERAELIHGTVEIESNLGKGVKITVNVPIVESE